MILVGIPFAMEFWRHLGELHAKLDLPKEVLSALSKSDHGELPMTIELAFLQLPDE